MADSHRLKIKKAITTQLETITTDNGYSHNVTVMRGRTRIDDNETNLLPLLSLVEPPDVPKTDYPQGAGYTPDTPWSLMLIGWVTPADDNPDDPAEALLQDVKKCLSALMASIDDLPVNGLADRLSLNTGICRGPDQQFGVSYFLLPITVQFTEDMRNP